ncbi:MAG: ChbG/HpnK family deacetylase [Candidatus Fermentibacteraceae bacterium]
MTRITVTIDDGGMNDAVNRAAALCMDAGVVNRLSIIPTGACVPAACELAMSRGVAVSTHLDCCSGPFLLPESRFPRGFATWAVNAGRFAPAVRREWCAQIERLLGLGAMVTNLDSHRHLHHLPGLREVFLDIARDYRIGTVRAAVLPDRMRRFPLGVFLHGLGVRLFESASLAGLRSASWMLGFGDSGRVGRKYLDKYMKTACGEDMELVMHPATEAVWSPGQPGELELMLSEWFAERTRNE